MFRHPTRMFAFLTPYTFPIAFFDYIFKDSSDDEPNNSIDCSLPVFYSDDSTYNSQTTINFYFSHFCETPKFLTTRTGTGRHKTAARGE